MIKSQNEWYDSEIDCVDFFDANPDLTYLQMDTIKRVFRLYKKEGCFDSDVEKIIYNLKRMKEDKK